MTLPTSKEEFITYIRRDLGEPVTCLNLDDDQIDDKVCFALSYYADYHFDATDKLYYKHQIVANDFPMVVRSLNLVSGGTGYTNGQLLVFTASTGQGAAGTVTTDGTGIITTLDLTDNGNSYATEPVVTVAGGGSGADITSDMGGWIEMPQNVIGVVKIFDLTNAITNISNLFSIQYQIALNEIWSLSSYSMVPYYTTIQHLNLIQQLLVGMQPVRYSRHRNRLHIDMAWERVQAGQFLVVEAYRVIDPDEFPDVWADRWLLRYATAQVKRVYGTNLKKYQGVPLAGGLTFSGQTIYNEAIDEITALENEMIDSYSIPNEIYTG